MTCYYDVLGVEKTATLNQIKKAYRTLVHEHHPDKNEGNQTEQFDLIQKAYEVLSDETAREIYDVHGVDKADARMAQLIGLTCTLIAGLIKANIPHDKVTLAAYEITKDTVAAMKTERQVLQNKFAKLMDMKSQLKAKESLKFDLLGESLSIMIRDNNTALLRADQDIAVHEHLLDFISRYERAEMPTYDTKGCHTYNMHSTTGTRVG